MKVLITVCILLTLTFWGFGSILKVPTNFIISNKYMNNNKISNYKLDYAVKPRFISNKLASDRHIPIVTHVLFVQNSLLPKSRRYNKLEFNKVFKRTMLSWAYKTTKKVAGSSVTTFQKRYAWGTYTTDKNQVWHLKEEMKRNPSVELKERIENLEGITRESGGINNEHAALGRSEPGSNKVRFKHNVTHGSGPKNKPLNDKQKVRSFYKEYTADQNDLVKHEELAGDGTAKEKAMDEKIKEIGNTHDNS